MEMYGMTGERLGTIGQVEPQKAIAKWKETMLAKPSISIRKGVARGYNPPYEDTDTLVLTAPSGTFVDIRFPLKLNALRSDPAFWAFAGKATTTFPEAASGLGMSYMAHCLWEHEIDSEEPSTDEGDLYLLGNGDVIEVGVGESEGRVQMYKEYWTSPEDACEKDAICTVARTIEAEAKVKGIVVRVGRYCQGILWQEGKDVHVGRWTSRKSVTGDEQWVHDQRSDGDYGIPCSWLCQKARQKDDEFVERGCKWKITEGCTQPR